MSRSKGKQKKGEQGIALVSTLLIAMALVTALVGITSVVVMNAKRTTTDESLVLEAQYAAEAGLTQAQTRVLEFSELLGKSALANDMTVQDMSTFAKSYCGTNYLTTVPPVGQWSEDELENGFQMCELASIEQASFDIFEDTIDEEVFEQMNIMSDASAIGVSNYWNEILSGGVTIDQAIDDNRSVQLTFGFEPVAVRALPDGGRRFVFKQTNTEALGTVYGDNGNILAVREVSLQPSRSEFYIDYGKPSFAQFNYFVNDRKGLWFAAATRFTGPAHVNGTTEKAGPSFIVDCNADQPVARFDGVFTAVMDQERYYKTTKCNGAVSHASMFRNDYKFGADYILLPDNMNNQRRAVTGEDATDPSDFSDLDMANTFGYTNVAEGVYYKHAANSSSPDNPDSWLGGIYVKGHVRDFLITTNEDHGSQIFQIEINKTNGARETTTFEQENTSQAYSWRVTNPDGSEYYLDNSFNGLIYVDGNIGRRCRDFDNKDCNRDHSAFGSGRGEIYMSQAYASNSTDARFFGLRGDGKENPDIAASSQITIATTGDLVIKQDITYTDDPVALGLDAKNVLGLYSNGGLIKVDGPYGKDVHIHASIMATAADKGFGALDWRKRKGPSEPAIKLVGGVIMNISPGISYGSGGYYRDYTFDERFEQGIAPPFFPNQTQWTSRVSSGLFNHGSTWQYGN